MLIRQDEKQLWGGWSHTISIDPWRFEAILGARDRDTVLMARAQPSPGLRRACNEGREPIKKKRKWSYVAV